MPRDNICMYMAYVGFYVCCSDCVGECVSACRCCVFVSWVHPVVVLNAAFCMTCSFLMLVQDARDDHMEEAYSRVSLMTAL